MIADLIERLKTKWAGEMKLRPGLSAAALKAFESKYQVVLPSAFREYFAAVDGTGDEMITDWCFCFWSLDKVEPITGYVAREIETKDSREEWFVFADHLIESFDFVIRLNSDPANVGPVAVPQGLELWPLAPSFEAFLELYLADEKNLFNFGPQLEE